MSLLWGLTMIYIYIQIICYMFYFFDSVVPSFLKFYLYINLIYFEILACKPQHLVCFSSASINCFISWLSVTFLFLNSSFIMLYTKHCGFENFRDFKWCYLSPELIYYFLYEAYRVGADYLIQSGSGLRKCLYAIFLSPVYLLICYRLGLSLHSSLLLGDCLPHLIGMVIRSPNLVSPELYICFIITVILPQRPFCFSTAFCLSFYNPYSSRNWQVSLGKNAVRCG